MEWDCGYQGICQPWGSIIVLFIGGALSWVFVGILFDDEDED